MLNITLIKEMVGISSSELLEIKKHQAYLEAYADDFYHQLSAWLESFDLQCKDEAQSLMLDNYYSAIISGEYGNDFYKVQYHQAMHLRRCGFSHSKSLLLLSHIRKIFIVYSEGVSSPDLAKGLCHVLDVSQSIMATVYQIAQEVDRMRARVDSEYKRIKRSFSLISAEPPAELMQPYLDHQEWKFIAFSVAVGDDLVERQIELSEQKCPLAQWLQNGGDAIIPALVRDRFYRAHEEVHRLGRLILEYGNNNEPEKVLDILMEIDVASSVVSDVLLDVIDNEFIRLAMSDSLTGMPNKHSFNIDFEKSIAFAERRGYWVGLVLIDIDHFKLINDKFGHLIGDNVLKELAQLIRNVSRAEETAYRWGGEEFVLVALDESPNVAEQLAERVRNVVQDFQFCQGTEFEMQLTISCGSVCFQPPINQPSHEIFAMVDKQLYKAKEKGRNCVEHLIMQTTQS